MTAKRKTVEPASARAQATRDAILAAAIEEFAARGPDGARIDRIASRAKANKERIYAYFGGKDRLFGAVLEKAFQEIAETERPLAEAATEGDPRIARRALNIYFAIHERHPHLWRLLAWANLTNRVGTAGARLASVKAASYAGLEKAYASAQKAGLYPQQASFSAFAYALIALSLVAFANRRTLASHLDLDLSTDEARHRLADELAALLERPSR